MAFLKSEITAKNLLRIKIISGVLYGIVLAGCSKYTFQPNGTIINGRSDIYLNDSLKLCLDVFGDYQLYSPKIMKGVKVNSFYKNDKSVLRSLGVNRTKSSILFSVEPVISPFFHMIVLMRDSDDVRLGGYHYRNIFDTVKYYYRRPEVLENFEVEETLIPYKNKYIAFIHYNDKINDCNYCDIESLTEKNSYRVLKGKQYDYRINLSACEANQPGGKILNIDIPGDKILKDKMGLLLVYKPAAAGKDREFETFKLLKPGEGHVDLNVCQGNHLIIYMDLEHHRIWSSQI